MDLSKLTTRAQQALVAARDQATARNHGGIHPAHLLRALVAQTEGLVLPLLQAIDVAPNDVRQLAEVELNKLPLVYGGSEPQMTQDLARVLEIADQRRSDFKDDYISVEHLLLGLAESSGPVGNGSAGPGGPVRGHPRRAQEPAGQPADHQRRPRGHLPGARAVRARPHRSGPGGKARPGHRARRGDPARDPGALAANQEQPGPHR